MLLAEHGAHTVRVEPPGGAQDLGTPHFHILNRGKRAIALDLDSVVGRGGAQALIRRADVVIAGFTPSRLRALGLDYPSVARLNPRVIALYMPPLGSHGPAAELDASEELVSAFAGIAGNQWARSGDPVPLTFPATYLRLGYSARWRLRPHFSRAARMDRRSRSHYWPERSRYKPAASCGTRK
jgi:crotonobetainyl-CoA:carnitine CoA-transferase CaiB-like acyl-CoA transferase